MTMRGVRLGIVCALLCCCGCRSMERLFPRLAADQRKPLTATTGTNQATLPGETGPANDAVVSAAKGKDPASQDRGWPPTVASPPPIDPHILKRKGIEPGSREAERLAAQSQYLDSPTRTRTERETHGIAVGDPGVREYNFQYRKTLE